MKNIKFSWGFSKKVNKENFQKINKLGLRKFVLFQGGIFGTFMVIAMITSSFLAGELNSYNLIQNITFGILAGLFFGFGTYFLTWLIARYP